MFRSKSIKARCVSPAGSAGAFVVLSAGCESRQQAVPSIARRSSAGFTHSHAGSDPWEADEATSNSHKIMVLM